MLGVVLFSIYAYFARGKQLDAWRAFGRAQRMELIPQNLGGFELRGQYNGFLVNLIVEVHRGSKGQKHYQTVLEVYLDLGIPGDFRIRREDILAKGNKLLGKQDIQVGLESVDRAFWIQGEQEEAIRQALRSHEARRALLALHERCADFELDELRFQHRYHRLLPLQKMLDELHFIIEQLHQLTSATRTRMLAYQDERALDAW